MRYIRCLACNKNVELNHLHWFRDETGFKGAYIVYVGFCPKCHAEVKRVTFVKPDIFKDLPTLNRI